MNKVKVELLVQINDLAKLLKEHKHHYTDSYSDFYEKRKLEEMVLDLTLKEVTYLGLEYLTCKSTLVIEEGP